MQTNTDCKLSIIIPHYNAPDLLDKLLSTVPDKDDVQTIVIDDHSSEEVKLQLQKIKLSYEGRRILFLDNDTEDHNAGAARNIGLKHAEGKWLFFADADDYFLDSFYDAVKRYFESDYDIVFFSFESIEIGSESRGVRQNEYCDYINSFLENPCDLTEANLRYKWMAPWGKLIKRSLIDSNKILFDSVRFSNDVMFSVKTGFFAEKIAASNEIIYCVTRRKGSLTTRLDLETFEIRAAVEINYYKYIKERLTKEEFREVEAYNISWQWLHHIIRRKYGRKVFCRYLMKFWKNRMFPFDIRIFTHLRPFLWLKARRSERQFRQRYEE